MQNEPTRHQKEYQQQEQEVDLVPVFVWIGNGFKNLFRGIGKVLGAIAHFFVLFLIFIKKNIIFLAIMVVVGFAIGFYLDQRKSEIFTSVVRVEPNFGSAAQIISNVEFYNSLVSQEDYERLGRELDITIEEAQAVKGFDVEADFSNNELLREYDALARTSDSVAVSIMNFEEFKDAKREIDYETYVVEVYAEDKTVAEKTAEKAVKVKELSAILASKKAAQRTAKFNIRNMENQLSELDSLVSSYQKAIVSSTQSQSAATNLYLSDQKPSEVLQQLFEQKKKILDDLRSERLQLYSYDNTVNVAAAYTKKGTVKSPHYKFKLGLVFLGLGLLIALIPVLFRWLNDYEAKHRASLN
jgi:hypothetical protein